MIRGCEIIQNISIGIGFDDVFIMMLIMMMADVIKMIKGFKTFVFEIFQIYIYSIVKISVEFLDSMTRPTPRESFVNEYNSWKFYFG